MSTSSNIKLILYFNFVIFLISFLPASSLMASRSVSLPLFQTSNFPPEDNNHRIQVMTPSGFKLCLEGRAFQPGEILLVRLEGTASIEQAWINGSGQKFYFFRKNSSGETKYYAFFGLDGELEPGEQSFELVIQKGDKSWEVTRFNLHLEGREYRKRKLRVASKYVEPPEELRERIEREAEIIRVIFSMVTPDWLGDGPFIRPHSGPVTACFGDQRLYNNQRLSFHSGVDLAASPGDKVVAANSGKVALASDFYFSGKIVILDHGLGLFTTYHHLDRITVRRGQMVKKGEIIGLAGSSGLSTGPHLHWSARVGQSRIDPLSLLALSFPGKE